MDDVIKMLKELERRSQDLEQMQVLEDDLMINSATVAPQLKRKKKKSKPKPPEPELIKEEAQTEAKATSSPAVVDDLSQALPPATPVAWNRQRVVDALQLMMLLGPPPGLDE